MTKVIKLDTASPRAVVALGIGRLSSSVLPVALEATQCSGMSEISIIDSSLNSQCVCEELSLLISLYGTPARLVIGGYTPMEVMETSNKEKNFFTNGPKNGARSRFSLKNAKLDVESD